MTKTLLGLVKFGVGGVVSLGACLAVTISLHEGLGVAPPWAYAAGLVVALVVNFCVTRWFIFRGTRRPIVSQFVHFVASSIGFRGLEYVAFLALYGWAGLNYVLVIVAVQGASFLAKFWLYSTVIFRRPSADEPSPSDPARSTSEGC